MLDKKTIQIGEGWKIHQHPEYMYLYKSTIGVGDVFENYNVPKKEFKSVQPGVPNKYKTIFRIYCYGLALRG